MSDFNTRRGGLRTLSEVSPALGGKPSSNSRDLHEILPALAAIGRGALKVAQHVGAGAAGLGAGLGAGALAGGLGAAKAIGAGASNAASSLGNAFTRTPPGNVASGPSVPSSSGPPSPPDAPTKFNWTR